jgi:hypothetical protein
MEENMTTNWKSWKLRPPWLAVVICFNAGLLVTIVVLTVLSSNNNGIATVQYASVTSFSDLSWTNLKDSQFRWTFVPTVVFTLFSLAYTTIVSANAERQPFVDLSKGKEKAKDAQRTILLDYPTVPILWDWFNAFRNSHLHLGFSMFFRLLASLALAPLASSLFRVDISQQQSPIVLNYPGAFNLSLFTERTDMQPSIDVSSAIHGYGAATPSWMTEKYALESFSPLQNVSTGNITLDTLVYYVEPQCIMVDRSQLNETYTPSSTPGSGEILVDYSDRNCSVLNQGTDITQSTSIIAITMYQVCHFFSEDMIGTLSGIISSSGAGDLENLTVISCQPLYNNSSATVTISLSPGQAGNVIAVTTHNSQPIGDLPQFRTLQSSVQKYTAFDASNMFSSDAFGKAVYYAAKRQSPATKLDPEAMLNATAALYTTMFANLASTQLTQLLDSPRTVNGTLSLAVTRLYVVLPAGCAMAGLLGSMLTSLVWLSVYSLVKKSILGGEPVGLLGRAAVLYHSEVTGWVEQYFAEEIREKDAKFGWFKKKFWKQPDKDEVVDFVKKHYNVKQSKCWFGASPKTGLKGIVVENLKPRDNMNRDTPVQRSPLGESVSVSSAEARNSDGQASGEQHANDGDNPERRESAEANADDRDRRQSTETNANPEEDVGVTEDGSEERSTPERE